MKTTQYEVGELMPAINRFIELANEIKNERDDNDAQFVAAALMAASGVFNTYVVAGNEGYMEPSGVEKMAGTYRGVLEQVQEWKKKNAPKGGQETG